MISPHGWSTSTREHALDLRASDREDVEVHVGVGALERAMLVPVGLADPQDVAATIGPAKGASSPMVRASIASTGVADRPTGLPCLTYSTPAWGHGPST